MEGSSFSLRAMVVEVRYSLCPWNSVRRRRYRPSLESGSERHRFILAMSQVQVRACTPCGLYSYILIIPSSSPVTRESSPAVKKKSAFVTQTCWVSFPSKTSLYGSSYIDNMRLKVTRQSVSSSTNLESNERKALHGVSNEEEVFQGTQGGHIHPDIHERDTHEAFIRVKSTNEDLGVEFKCAVL